MGLFDDIGNFMASPAAGGEATGRTTELSRGRALVPEGEVVGEQVHVAARTPEEGFVDIQRPGEIGPEAASASQVGRAAVLPEETGESALMKLRRGAEVPTAVEQGMRRAEQLATTSLPEGESYVVERPGIGSVQIKTSQTTGTQATNAGRIVTNPPVASGVTPVHNPVTNATQRVPGGIINYGPIYTPQSLLPSQSWVGIQWGRMKNLMWNTIGKHLPGDVYIGTRVPNSMVLIDITRWEEATTSFVQDAVRQPWYTGLRKFSDEQLIAFEHQAYIDWVAGGKTVPAYNAAISKLPQELQNYFKWRTSKVVEESMARKYLGLKSIPEVDSPYIPRLTKSDLDDIFNVRRGGYSFNADAQQTIRSFANSRSYATQKLGVDAGVEYVPVNHAILMREYEGAKLRSTAKLMRELEEHNVIFRSKAAAEAQAATMGAGAKVSMLKGMPGAQELWWTATSEEGLVLEQNLSKALGSGALGRIGHWANLMFRNINLTNPYPHRFKNMWVKYLLAAGDPRKLGREIATFEAEANTPMGQLFRQLIPFGDTAETSATIAAHQSLLRNPIAAKIENTIAKVQSFSGNYLFTRADPALRYALWKSHMAKGMNPVEAANHVIFDLIRYGAKSDLMNFWKRVPMNFFAPWRFGSVASVLKQAYYHPYRTALTIGALEYARESIYRNTGYWFHMPFDYADGPIASMLMSDEKAKALLWSGVSTLAFGPGGSQAADTINNFYETLRIDDPTEWKKIGQLFWGVTAMYEAGSGAYDMLKSLGKGDLHGALNGLAHTASGMTLGAHQPAAYVPKRTASFLPEWLPGLKRSPDIAEKERIIDILHQRSERTKEKQRIKREAVGPVTERILRSRGIIK